MSRPHWKPTRSPVTTRRLGKGWTLDALHRESGVSLPHISAVERGTRKATARTWKRLAQALGVSVADLKAPEAADPRQPELFDGGTWEPLALSLWDWDTKAMKPKAIIREWTVWGGERRK